ncbi:MAG: hypothetical protein IH846_16975, partial [Acidobacteria bacterium]|nr:hypothetical protein [Acidobacteriota bacterium]
YSRCVEKFGDNDVAFTTFRLGETYHAKEEIDAPEAGARIVEVSDGSHEKAELQMREEVLKLLSNK